VTSSSRESGPPKSKKRQLGDWRYRTKDAILPDPNYTLGVRVCQGVAEKIGVLRRPGKLLRLLDVRARLLDAAFKKFRFHFRLLPREDIHLRLKGAIAGQLDFNLVLSRADQQGMK
jgi:hypothetical protein